MPSHSEAHGFSRQDPSGSRVVLSHEDDLLNPRLPGALEEPLEACGRKASPHVAGTELVIDGCDSGVANVRLRAGCSVNDLISRCAENAGSHRHFVRCVAEIAKRLQRHGLIGGKDAARIVRCARRASIP